MNWDAIYNFFGAGNFIYFISSSELQDAVFPLKLVFIFFGALFLAAVIYFYINSSYIQHQFLQDTFEFLSWQPWGLRQINKIWQKIIKRIETGGESEYKVAIVEADDLLYKILEDKGYEGDSFEQLLKSAGRRILPSFEEISLAHSVRNSVVHDPDYKLDLETAKRTLNDYEKAIKNI